MIKFPFVARSTPFRTLFALLLNVPLVAQSSANLIDYHREVHSILSSRCLTCHNQDKRSGGLSLAVYEDIINGGRTGAAIKPGRSTDSLIVQRLTGAIQPQMPLNGDPLSEKEIAIVRTWIDQGARMTPASAPAKGKWEPQLTLQAPAAPDLVWKNWTDPVDRFTAQYLAQHKVPEPHVVSDAEFARRAYIDIWGLLPDPAQLQAFVADTQPDKRRQLVDRLLADDTKYSENWISYWNDLLRNDEGVVYYSETANRKTITPWLLRALETNKPYNQWIVELLNPTKETDPDGFLIGVNWRGAVSASQTPALQASQNIAQIFLGINFKCNSCHDSFISKWKLKDAYALASYFSTEEKLQLYRCDVAQNQFVSAAFMYPALDRTLPSASVADRRATAAAIITDPRNGRMPRTVVNRIWQKLMGRGFVADVDDMDGEPWSPELLDWLSSDFATNGYDLKRLIATIISSRTYQLPAIARTSKSPKEYTFHGPELRRLTAEQFADAVSAITGDWHVAMLDGGRGPGGQPGATPFRGGPRPIAVISGEPSEAAGRVTVPRPVTPSGGFSFGAGRPGQFPIGLLPVPAANYVREWRVAGSSLTRALGRPIRDQVYTTRETVATTVQALELVNGEGLNHWLWRGARRMLGELPPEPKSLLTRQVFGGRGSGGTNPAQTLALASAALPTSLPAPVVPSAPALIQPLIPAAPARPVPPPPPVPFDIDISKSQKLYLIVEDNRSTAPDKATPIWLDGTLSGPEGSVPLTSLKSLSSAGLREESNPVIPAGATEPVANALRVKFPSVLVYDIAGKGFTRFQGATALENVNFTQGETVTARFFVFDQQPSMDRLVPPIPTTPLPPEPVLTTIPETVTRVYWHALGRAPSAAERRIAEAALRKGSAPGKPSADGLADLLWAVLMSPEFQLIR